MLSIKPSIKIILTILAKNEEDVIGTNIEHHLSQGVTRIILTDNASTDHTRTIAEKYPEVEILDEPGDTHNQPEWVSRMARLACKMEPDWIVHADADELWCNLTQLRNIKSSIAGCERMYLHPPTNKPFELNSHRHFLNFDAIPIPQECKIAHRPDPEIRIAHGNHGVIGKTNIEFTAIPRHHYPVRSYQQWTQKSMGHEALKRRGSICERWERWYNLLAQDKLKDEYSRLTKTWEEMIAQPNHQRLLALLGFWATPEMMGFFEKNPGLIPRIEEWPRTNEIKKSSRTYQGTTPFI